MCLKTLRCINATIFVRHFKKTEVKVVGRYGDDDEDDDTNGEDEPEEDEEEDY